MSHWMGELDRVEGAVIEKLRRVSLRHCGLDILLMAVSGVASFLIVWGFDHFRENAHFAIGWILFSAIVRVTIFIFLGIYDRIWRYVSLKDAAELTKAMLIASIVLFTVYVSLVSVTRAHLTIFVVNQLQILVLCAGARVIRRIFHESSDRFSSNQVIKRTLIVGAGHHGRDLAHRFQVDGSLGIQVVGFIDDHPGKIGHLINGVRVLSSSQDLAKIVSQLGIKEVIVAIPDLPGVKLREMIQALRPFHIRPRLMSEFNIQDFGKRRFELIREFSLDDLLKRPKVEIDLSEIRHYCRGKRILVTGAGGSIGSEIVKQILSFDPGRLFVLDSAEFNLFTIDEELKSLTQDPTLIVPVLVDLKDRASLDAVMSQYQPQVVFHAAAYKHVHLVEQNAGPSVLNNIGGTRNLLDCSQKVGVEVFIQISTDKAVNPVGVMGATKRVCELMVSRVGKLTGRRYCTVRFGNVVGSSGSLIPLLKKQIRSGGPVTITDEGMTRYFMLIREAVSLVLKSASIAGPGDICILRMGEPIKIVDIAKNLMMLLGKSEEEIPIVFIGARPGEKLHEELYLSGEEINTSHPDILLLPKGNQRSITSLQEGELLDYAVNDLLNAALSASPQVIAGKLMAIATPGADEQSDRVPGFDEFEELPQPVPHALSAQNVRN